MTRVRTGDPRPPKPNRTPRDIYDGDTEMKEVVGLAVLHFDILNASTEGDGSKASDVVPRLRHLTSPDLAQKLKPEFVRFMRIWGELALVNPDAANNQPPDPQALHASILRIGGLLVDGFGREGLLVTRVANQALQEIREQPSLVATPLIPEQFNPAGAQQVAA